MQITSFDGVVAKPSEIRYPSTEGANPKNNSVLQRPLAALLSQTLDCIRSPLRTRGQHPVLGCVPYARPVAVGLVLSRVSGGWSHRFVCAATHGVGPPLAIDCRRP